MIKTKSNLLKQEDNVQEIEGLQTLFLFRFLYSLFNGTIVQLDGGVK